MLPSKIIEDTFSHMKIRLNSIDDRIDRLESLSEIAGVAFTVNEYTYANRPLSTEDMNSYALGIISDGRDIGEGAGNGTGVLCIYKPTPLDEWYRVADNTAVVT